MALGLQKANFWKRFSAWMLDTMLVAILAIACSLPILNVLKFDENSVQLTAVYDTVKAEIEAEYGVDLDLKTEEYEKLPDSAKDTYKQAQNALNTALASNADYAKLRANRVSIIITDACIALFLAILLAHFVLPLILKNGQTLGKKAFGLAVVRTNCVKLTPTALFLRSMVGLFAMETMAVAFLLLIYPVGLIAAVLVQALQVGVMIKTPANQSIHDLLSDSTVVDFASQKIFENEAERLEYVKAEAEKAAIADGNGANM